MSVKIYLVYGPQGEYEDYYEEFIGAFINPENAHKAAEDWYEQHTSKDHLPMTLERYEELNFGYADGDWEGEGPRGRDGFTEEDFEIMEEAWSDQYNSYYDPIVREEEIKDIENLNELIYNE